MKKKIWFPFVADNHKDPLGIVYPLKNGQMSKTFFFLLFLNCQRVNHGFLTKKKQNKNVDQMPFNNLSANLIFNSFHTYLENENWNGLQTSQCVDQSAWKGFSHEVCMGCTPTINIAQPPTSLHRQGIWWMEDLSNDFSIFISTAQPIRGYGAEVLFNTSAICLCYSWVFRQHTSHNSAFLWLVTKGLAVHF